MRTLVVIIALICSNFASSQVAMNLEFVTISNASVIAPTWQSLRLLLFTPEDKYQTTLKYYGYQKGDDETYYASTTVGYYTINRTSREILFYSEKDNNFIYNLRKEIVQNIPSPRATYNGNFETYFTTFVENGITYRVEVLIKSTASGGSMIGFILR